MGQWLVAALETTDNTITLPVGVDWRVLGFAAMLAIATCLLFGLAPAIRATRVAAVSVLRVSTRGATAGRESVALRRGLVVVQIALSVALLFGSLLFARTLRNVLNVDPGFRADGLVVAGVNASRLSLPVDRLAAHRQELIDRVRAIPGVQAVSTVDVAPVSGDSGGNDVWPERDRTAKFNTLVNFVGQGYFATLGVPFTAGRDFDGRDVPESTRVVIVNETFAAKLGGAAAAVGQRVTRESTPRNPEKTFEIIGVVKDSTYRTVKEDPYPVLFYPSTQDDPGRYNQLIVRSSLPPAATTAAMTATLAGIDRRLVVSYSVVPTMIHDTLVQERLLATLSSGFALLAAVLTVVGLYGLIAYSVTRRTSEIGVRLALGAGRGDILRLILRETGILVGVGVALGAGLAVGGGLTASTLLFRVRPYDPLTLAAAVGILSAIALCASYAPARRATRIHPVVALRAD
jgi:predicted permease